MGTSNITVTHKRDGVRFKTLTAVTFWRLRYVVWYKFIVSKEPLLQSSGQNSPISVQEIRDGVICALGRMY
jgi:hypothetical protein